jgi:hypothetical protein
MQVTPPSKIFFKDLKQKILTPSLTTHYLMEITPPENIKTTMIKMDAILNKNTTYDSLSISCSEASLPGSSLATIDIANDYRGINEKHAYRRMYDDTISFTFYVDSTSGKEYYVIKFFEGWLAYITNQDSDLIPNKNFDYRVRFPSDYYAPSLTIQKFEKNFGSISDEKVPTPLQYEFYKAFPINLNSMPLSYDGAEILKCTVDFSYSKYKLIPSNYKSSMSQTTRNENAPGNPDVPPPPTTTVTLFGSRPTDIPQTVTLQVPNSDNEGPQSTLGQLNPF